jgi:hypothetical protein
VYSPILVFMRSMGSKPWIVLALALAGCGRLGFGESGDESDDGGGGNLVTGVVDENARAPAICERIADIATTATADVDLAVATTPSGATVVWSAVAGSQMFGVDIAASRQLGTPGIVRDGSFTATSATYIDGKLVTAGVNSTRTLIHEVPQPLATAVEIANIDGMFVGKTTLAHSGGDRVIATSCSSGLTMSAFDFQWNSSEGTLSVSTNATQNIDQAPMGGTAFAVWSTAASCHYEIVTSRTTGTTRQTMSRSCDAARVASSGFDVAIVFQESGRAGLVIDDAGTVSVTNAAFVTGARSPRVLWDGARYWASYLDATDRIVVGYVDAGGSLVRAQLPDAAPASKAYELGMLDGQVWVFGVEPTTRSLSASRLCIPAT